MIKELFQEAAKKKKKDSDIKIWKKNQATCRWELETSNVQKIEAPGRCGKNKK